MANDSMDLVVTQFNLGELTTNAQVLLDAVREKLKGYNAENYSEDNIEEAKKDKAELNAAAEKLNKKRIELEFEFNKPFTPFKNTVNEICNEIKKASKEIDGIVVAVDERERKQKEAEIVAFYTEQKCDLFPLSMIFNPRWLNKTYKMKDIKAEISEKILKTNEELETLNKLGEPDAQAFYLQTLDLNLALAKANDIKAHREKLAALEKARQEREEADRKAPAAPEEPKAEPEVTTEAQGPAPAKEPGDEEFYREPVFTVTLAITGTTENLRALKEFMAENNLTYKKIEGGAGK